MSLEVETISAVIRKGMVRSWAYTDQALFGLDLDFQKMIGWEGASFEFYITKRTGKNLEQ